MSPPALLVIDIQRGAFDGVRCPPIDRPAALVRNALALVTAAREGDSPVIFIQHCDGASQPFEEGTTHWELHEQLVPRAGESILRKYASSAFENTELEATLRALGVGDLVVCGLQSEFCV
jgi:nicotinamidase-related amidase